MGMWPSVVGVWHIDVGTVWCWRLYGHTDHIKWVFLKLKKSL